MKKFQVLVFGKAGCDKCKVLNKRLDTLLAKEDWQDFEKVYCDMETEDGLVEFSNAECINPQRIPAMLVKRLADDDGQYEPVNNPRRGQPDKVCGNSKLYTYVGLQTDYGQGGGVITPHMITSVLEDARRGVTA